MTLDSTLAQRYPLRILIAEDNSVNQKLALSLLLQLGYRAEAVGNGLEVLKALEHRPYDLVLMDVQMPIMDGLTATREICRRWPQRRPWIVAVTANAMAGDRAACLAAGMDTCITKPLRGEELLQVLVTCPQRNRPSLGASDPRTAVLDSAQLRDYGVGADTQAMLIDLFLGDTPELLARIEAAVAANDSQELAAAAHALKSSSATLGAIQMRDLCLQLEQMGHAGEATQAVPQLQLLHAAYGRTIQAMAALKANPD